MFDVLYLCTSFVVLMRACSRSVKAEVRFDEFLLESDPQQHNMHAVINYLKKYGFFIFPL